EMGGAYKIALFNGKMNAHEKDRQWRRFKDEASIMISTEAGGECRNFQFAHILVNYDLPWNPMKVEQRIGRLDRIGQTHQVLVYNFSIEDTVEDRVLELLQHRIHLFEETVGGLDPILGAMEHDILDLVFAPPEEFDRKFQHIEEQLQLDVERARRMEEEMADFILDRRSFRADETAHLLGRAPVATFEDLESFVVDQLAEFPGDGSGPRVTKSKRGSIGIIVPRVLQRFQRGLQEEYVGTFSAKLALDDEGLEFFAFGHPLVDVLVARAQGPEYVPPAAAFRLEIPSAERFEGYRLLFQISVKSAIRQDRPMVENRKLFEIWIDKDGELRDDLAGALLRAGHGVSLLSVASEQIERLGYVMIAATGLAASESDAHAASQKIVFEQLYDEELQRIERLRDWRLSKLEDERSQRAETLARMRASDSLDTQRVLPAVEGRLRKTEERIESARSDYARDVEGLGERGRVATSFDLLSVAYIEVEHVA
ncbi:MAG: helicase-related protein, partial [Candidatus Nanopelagicales bacterium]